METQEISVRAPGSFIVIGGALDIDLPMLGDSPVRLWADDQCVCVGTLCEVDGQTRVLVGASLDRSNLTLAFDGEIRTESRRLMVSDAQLNSLVEVAVRSDTTSLSIWTDDAREPTVIAIDVASR